MYIKVKVNVLTWVHIRMALQLSIDHTLNKL